MKYKSKYIALKQKEDDPNYSIIKVNKRINGMCKNTKNEYIIPLFKGIYKLVKKHDISYLY